MVLVVSGCRAFQTTKVQMQTSWYQLASDVRSAQGLKKSLPGPSSVVLFGVCIWFMIRISMIEPKAELPWKVQVRFL